MASNFHLIMLQQTGRDRQGWTLVELVLTCGVLAIVVLLALARLNPSYRADQDVNRVANQLQHVLEAAREKARHDRMSVRVLVSEDPAPCYWQERMPETLWEPLGEKHLLVPRVSFSGDLCIEFRPDGTAKTTSNLWILEHDCQRQLIVAQATGRVTVLEP